MNLDALIFAAHPDDAEIGMGGTIAKLTKNNFKVGIIDLTRGELGTRGTEATRQKEAFQAAIILKAAIRDNLHIPDGKVITTRENMLKVVMSIRKYKPSVIFAPYKNDRHPDHIATSELVKQAYFYSGVNKIKTFDKDSMQQSFRPKKLYYYMQAYQFEPSFIVDISDTFEIKMNAIKAFETQFYNPKQTDPETFISSPEFLKYIESRSQIYGFKINKKYGEPFFTEEGVEVSLETLMAK